MKSFSELIVETGVPALADRDICWYLRQPSFGVLRTDIVTNPNKANSTAGMHISVVRFLRSLIEWKQGSTAKAKRAELDGFAHEHIMSCDPSSRAPWTKHVGKVYRGLMKTQSTLDGMKLRYTGEVITLNVVMGTRSLSFPALVATGSYRSAYRYQSWTTVREVAYEFAQGSASGMMSRTKSKIGMILEVDLKPSDNALFIDTFPRMGREHEVIVGSNGSVPVTAYVSLADLCDKFVAVGSPGLQQGHVIDSKKARKILGASYDLIARSPNVSSYMKKQYGVDFSSAR